ncbi:hypothetical protein [Ligilactobacillus pobuzihii]|uniref:Uncharacterized protein n=1 Tax=Ligilactobacillus pobuzihii TaxID=449659 RepID=A0A0R2LRA7_9LACO|nr:hypothetical protein [Ligilactobacillus pobuzihii]KRK10229.1 hypothetical protein FD11_GL001977 [Ligilactobacillus pobuzihii E100301 = KCTC 13174]KRO02098.1 hypothetical protein IV66_GL001768 [Ligilactobacillus pobuzihii]GEN48144.1 hypothetical protein LPO01_09360 [Ligilactobacillus pobuzihii]
MKDNKTKIDNARTLGFVGGITFACAVNTVIMLPAIALRLGTKGKRNLHRGHYCHHQTHEAAGPVHFLAEQHAQQVKDEHELLADIRADLDEIKEKLDKPVAPEPPKPDPEKDKGPEPPRP